MNCNLPEPHLCSPEEACDSGDYSYVHSSDKTLVNWLVDFELACWSKEELSWLSTIFFGGFLIGSLIILPLADVVGRRPLILTGLIIHLTINIILNFVHKMGYLYPYLVIFGIRVPMAN